MKPVKEEPKAGSADGGKGKRKKLYVQEPVELGTKQLTFAKLHHILVL